MESAAMGLLAGLNAAFVMEGRELHPPPVQTAMGALLHYIVSPSSADNFQPMNINFGLLNTEGFPKMKKKEKNASIVNQALQSLNEWMTGHR